MRPRADTTYSPKTSWGDRQASPHFPSLADVEARRKRRNATIGRLMLYSAYMIVGACLIMIAVGP